MHYAALPKSQITVICNFWLEKWLDLLENNQLIWFKKVSYDMNHNDTDSITFLYTLKNAGLFL